MKKLSSLFAIVMVLMLALTACASGTQNQNGTGTVAPGAQSTGLPNTGATASPLGTATSPITTTSVLTATSPVATTPAMSTSPTAANTPTTAATSAVTGTPSAAATQLPLTNKAQIIPNTGRPQATRLSNLMQYQVQDQNGNTLGTVNDYILNVCEAHILYIVLNPDSTLGVSGKQVLIPYEAVTLGGGEINVDQKAIVLKVDSSVVSGAPAFDINNLDLSKVDWEQNVQAYWSNYVKLSLTSKCHVQVPSLLTTPGVTNPVTPVVTGTVGLTGTMGMSGTVQTTAAPNMPQDQAGIVKLALASKVLNGSLVDGNGNNLGTINEMILVPESGLLRYAVVQLASSLQAGQKTVLVPIRAINVQHPMQGQTDIVLLVKTDILKNAPEFNNSQSLNSKDASWDQDAFNYWSQYVTLQKQSQP